MTYLQELHTRGRAKKYHPTNEYIKSLLERGVTVVSRVAGRQGQVVRVCPGPWGVSLKPKIRSRLLCATDFEHGDPVIVKFSEDRKTAILKIPLWAWQGAFRGNEQIDYEERRREYME